MVVSFFAVAESGQGGPLLAANSAGSAEEYSACSEADKHKINTQKHMFLQVPIVC